MFKNLLVVSCALAVSYALNNASAASLVIYPEYPHAIERDHAYDVTVVQGEDSKKLVVYNHCEKSILSSRTHGGDVNRRFCEFAFEDAPVRVDIAVHEDVKCYKVFPARLHLKHEFKDGVISIMLEKPAYFGIQLNDYDKTILSVFADAPEKPEEIPVKGAPGIMFVEGWMDATSPDGVIQTGDDIKEIYLAPGSVLNARLRMKGKGTRLHGRGMVLDPMSDVFRFDQSANNARGLVTSSASDISVEGVKLVDARTFNFIGWGQNLVYRNIKVLASMMCSDGFTNGGGNLLVENAWVYCGDNAIVVSGLKNATYRKVALGTSCAAIFPQGTNKQIVMDDIDVFRADDGLINNSYNGVLRRNNKWNEMNGGAAKAEPGPQDLMHQEQEFTFNRLAAIDCTLFSHFFAGRNMGDLPKTFTFNDSSIPYSTGSSHWKNIGKTDGVAISVTNDPARYLITSNYTITFNNLCLGGKPVESFPTYAVKATAKELKLNVALNPQVQRMVPMAPERREVNWTCPAERRLQSTPAPQNILQDNPATRSIWQRCPSWSVKFDATRRDEQGAVIYRLFQCERNAGMQAVVTERILAAGMGTYHLSFDAKARSDNPFGLNISVVSNEKTIAQKLPDIERNGEWKRYELDFTLNFDNPATDLAAVFFATTATANEILFRNLVFTKEK